MNRPIRPMRARMIIALVGAALVTACESSAPVATLDSDEGSQQGSGRTTRVTLVAGDNFFRPTALDLRADSRIELEFTNRGQEPHTFTIRDLDVDTGSVDPGDSTSVTFVAPQDPTEFVCTIHEFQGQVGQITPK